MDSLSELKSKYFDYLSQKYGVTAKNLSDPLDYVLEEVAVLDSSEYREVGSEELVDVFNRGFDNALELEDYIWNSDISPHEIERLLSASQGFAAAEHTEGGENRYAFVIEGNLKHFTPPEDADSDYLFRIEASPVVLTGTVWERPEKGLFDCRTGFKLI